MATSLPVTIRPVHTDDFKAWLPLWAGYNQFYGRFGPTALADDITAMTWSRFFDAYEPVHALVAESGGELVGLTHYLYHRSTTRIGPVCYLQDLFTAESVRGRGVGKALIEAVYEQARAAGSSRVYWQTHKTNATAMRLEPVYDLKGAALGCNRDEWAARARRMGSCPCKGLGGSIARFHPNPEGKYLLGRSAALRR